MQVLPGGDSPYEPIDPNPSVGRDAGYMNAVPPPPGQGASEADIASYATQPNPMGANRLSSLMSTMGPVRQHVSGFAYSMAGAAILSATKKGGKLTPATLLKGAVGGVIICAILARKVSSVPCTAAAVVGGYAAARLLK